MGLSGKDNSRSQKKKKKKKNTQNINFKFKFHFPLFKLDFLHCLNVILLHLDYYSDT